MKITVGGIYRVYGSRSHTRIVVFLGPVRKLKTVGSVHC